MLNNTSSAHQLFQDTSAFSLVIVRKPVAMSAKWYWLKAGFYAVLWYRLQVWFDACDTLIQPLHMTLMSNPDEMAQGQELQYRLWLAGKAFGLEHAPRGIRAREWAQQELEAMDIPDWMITGAIYGIAYWQNWREKYAAKEAA